MAMKIKKKTRLPKEICEIIQIMIYNANYNI